MNQHSSNQNNTDDRGQTRADRWIEPFYDLVIGTVIGQLSSLLSSPVSGDEYLQYCWLFLPTWWLWTGFSFYFDRFDRNSIFQQSALLISLIPIVLLSVTAPQTFNDKIAGFTWSYIAARFILLVLYVYTIVNDSDFRRPARHLLIGFSGGLSLWILGAFWTDYGIYLKIAGLVIDLATPWIARDELRKVAPTKEHFPQRLGVFTLIVVEQNVMNLSNSLTERLWGDSMLISAFCGLVLIVTIWWWYFFHQEEFIIGRIQNDGLRHSFGHMPLYLGTGTLALAVSGAVAQEDSQRWLLTLGMSLYAGSLCLTTLPKIKQPYRFRYLLFTIALLLVCWGITVLVEEIWVALASMVTVWLIYLYFARNELKSRALFPPKTENETPEEDGSVPLRIG
ncbi:low temperature requirement protein A [Siphonobacter sp. SORGH_AS_0500]|uniref:low temperature requirement protein A n=1 Tax=Siphonobacter sp. SORGH_AS_0500 TaxID=1864824 RepID=UPI0028591219|nr:low temperature requirement protein A [Siphonobacter sp. SORGH_AS_0500]MDR6197552.1 low temperature requirement protein LtrA [Siphonobacter sp. SORGH_AS_0500]